MCENIHKIVDGATQYIIYNTIVMVNNGHCTVHKCNNNNNNNNNSNSNNDNNNNNNNIADRADHLL